MVVMRSAPGFAAADRVEDFALDFLLDFLLDFFVAICALLEY
jgi:hypothetical protein